MGLIIRKFFRGSELQKHKTKGRKMKYYILYATTRANLGLTCCGPGAYPSSHSHWNVPSKFVHVPLPHMLPPLKHSSLSKNIKSIFEGGKIYGLMIAIICQTRPDENFVPQICCRNFSDCWREWFFYFTRPRFSGMWQTQGMLTKHNFREFFRCVCVTSGLIGLLGKLAP